MRKIMIGEELRFCVINLHIHFFQYMSIADIIPVKHFINGSLKIEDCQTIPHLRIRVKVRARVGSIQTV